MRNNFASKWKQQRSAKRRHYMGRSEVSTSVVKCNEGLSNKVSIIIRGYRDQMHFAACMVVSVIIYFLIVLVLFCIIVYMVVCFV